jgi:hypothetical protein
MAEEIDVDGLTWSIEPPDEGTIDGDGKYGAPATVDENREVTVIAQNHFGRTRTAVVKLKNESEDRDFRVEPERVELQAGETQQFKGVEVVVPEDGEPRLDEALIRHKFFVPSGNSPELERLIREAKPWTLIELEESGTYTGTFSIVSRTSHVDGPIVIRSRNYDQGVRVSEPRARTYATLVCPPGRPAIKGHSKAPWCWLQGVQCVPDSTQPGREHYSSLEWGTEDLAPADQAGKLWVQRTIWFGRKRANARRAMFVTANDQCKFWENAIIGFHHESQQAQGILIGPGRGPYELCQNHIWGGGEGIMLGGVRPGKGTDPSATILRNVIRQTETDEMPIDGQINCIELKLGKHVVIANNWLMGTKPGHGQRGFGGVLTPRTHGGGQADQTAHLRDLRIRRNVWRWLPNWLNLLGYDNNGDPKKSGLSSLRDVAVEENLVFDLDRPPYRSPDKHTLQILNGCHNVSFEGNTVVGWPDGNSRIMLFAGLTYGPSESLRFVTNLWSTPRGSIHRDDGKPWAEWVDSNVEFVGNAFARSNQQQLPDIGRVQENIFPASVEFDEEWNSPLNEQGYGVAGGPLMDEVQSKLLVWPYNPW